MKSEYCISVQHTHTRGLTLCSWWKVKIRGDSSDADTPVGLVPAAYVEQVRFPHNV
jgi:hypothetical protein